MKLSRRLLVSCLTLAVASCASLRNEPDPLCKEIAAFANATPAGSTHVVALTTAWGPTKEHPDSLMNKNCEHSGYAPGAKLCQYLMANTSTEFAEYNFRRALACISGQRATPPKYVAVERLDTLVWGYEAPGVQPEISVGIEFATGGDRTPVLKLMAEADEP